MRAGLLLACVIALVPARSDTASSAPTELERDERAATKYGLPLPDRWDAKARGLCVCLDHPLNPAFEDKLGLVVIERANETIGGEERRMIQVTCQPFGYDPATEERNVFVRCDTWIPLAK